MSTQNEQKKEQRGGEVRRWRCVCVPVCIILQTHLKKKLSVNVFLLPFEKDKLSI